MQLVWEKTPFGSCRSSVLYFIWRQSFLPKMEIEHLRKTFSFVEPCIRRWEAIRSIRKTAIQGYSIIQSDKGPVLSPFPKLDILSKNYELLKGFTEHMANTGVICARLLPPIEKTVVAFYELMERKTTDDDAFSVCHRVSCSLKKMLGVIRRKWKRWELPRAP